MVKVERKIFKNVFVVLAIALILSSAIAFAETAPSDNQMISDAIQIYGTEQQLPEGQKLIVENGVVYAPLDFVVKAMGKNVVYHNDGSVSIESPGMVSANPFAEQLVGGTLWLKSGEGRALSYQAFNLAKMMFDKAAAENKGKVKLAVITDIDDTIVDTSQYTTQIIAAGEERHTPSWNKWVMENTGRPLPGAVEFMNYVVNQGGDVYYITNRQTPVKDATINALATLGFPQANSEHVFVRDKNLPRSKEGRRQIVAKDHKIALLMGDNLEDFSDVFEPTSTTDRMNAVHKESTKFGTYYIVLPNPMYGTWERAIYHSKSGLTPEEKEKMRKDELFGNN